MDKVKILNCQQCIVGGYEDWDLAVWCVGTKVELLVEILLQPFRTCCYGTSAIDEGAYAALTCPTPSFFIIELTPLYLR